MYVWLPKPWPWTHAETYADHKQFHYKTRQGKQCDCDSPEGEDMKDIKDIAKRYNMDEEALTARLKALHERYLDNEKQYNELLDEAASRRKTSPTLIKI